jgi:hypothetical protein
MALTTRQSNLLVQQDWTKVYQTFRDADFQSYDYETLRKSMIDYLRTYYPEDFNDFTESSEYIALIDLIAFLGQSLAFRTDLNARENFIDTAERRDSVLKLARLISYNPKRNTAASGFLKIGSVSTTESVTDSNGINLSNLLVSWNDTSNENWLEQYTAILNASMVNTQVVGKPGAANIINGIQTDEYSVNVIAGATPIYKFTAKVENSSMNFEVVSASAAGQSYVYEVDPTPSGKFNLLYKNDNQGNGSNNTGFFVYFKQGDLNALPFNIAEKLPNRVVSINFSDINNNDVWLYPLTAQGTLGTKWTKVPAIGGVNIVYNQTNERNLYQVNSRANDQVDLVFGDGAFASIPQGDYKLFYRQSNGQNYKITPDEMQNVVISMNYVSRNNRVETLTLSCSLHYTVANSSAAEALDDIRTKAPQQYYTQNRMITGEDYNILPYTTFSNIIKVKAVNRTSSGVSRYLDVTDVSGKYSSTNIFAQDGVIYRNIANTATTFTYTTTSEVLKAIYNVALPMISAKEIMHLYHYSAPTYLIGASPTFVATSSTTNTTSGYINTVNTLTHATTLTTLGVGASGAAKYIQPGALVKFLPPQDYHFNKDNQIVAGAATLPTDKTYLYAAVVSNTSTTVTFSQILPTTLNTASGPVYAVVSEITPPYKNDWPTSLIETFTTLILGKKNFGVRYDAATMEWVTIDEANLNLNQFDITTAGSTQSASDSSWILAFTYFSGQYTITQRNLYYYMESELETRFYFDPKVKVYDSSTGTAVRDQIKILKVNNDPVTQQPLSTDQIWYVYNNVVQLDGYLDTQKILVTFPDANNDGIPDDPTLFNTLVAPDSNTNIFFKQVTDYDNFVKYAVVSLGAVVDSYLTKSQIALYSASYSDGQVFYATAENKFYSVTGGAVSITNNYVAKTGRQNLYFQYRHNSPGNRRIDPSPNNIMDLYILTKEYNTAYAAWIKDSSGKVAQPVAPTTEELRTEFSTLENLKALSDTIIYNPVKFKPIFGNKAASVLRATFKVVKNSNVTISDNDIKSRVISTINKYFDINNWDFGETFYFSELSAYLHTELVPNISSIIIVPSDSTASFGGLYQINAEANEIVVSAATVDNVEIISAITASQINQSLAGLNTL